MDGKLRVSFTGMDSSDALRDYALEKFSKHQHLMDLTIIADINLIQHVPRRGKSNDFEITAMFTIPKGSVYVNELGEDMYAIIDTASDKLFRRMNRYKDKLSQWQGETDWESVDMLEDLPVEVTETEPTSFVDYVPKIVERKVMEYQTPMDEAEAIERMELSGVSQMLFKSKKTGRVAMVYQARRRGGYGIIDSPEL